MIIGLNYHDVRIVYDAVIRINRGMYYLFTQNGRKRVNPLAERRRWFNMRIRFEILRIFTINFLYENEYNPFRIAPAKIYRGIDWPVFELGPDFQIEISTLTEIITQSQLLLGVIGRSHTLAIFRIRTETAIPIRNSPGRF